jgi:hypothetical protein
MKARFLLFPMLFLFCSNIRSQTLPVFPTEPYNSYWVLYFQYMGEPFGPTFAFVSGDTIIGNDTLHRITNSGWQDGYEWYFKIEAEKVYFSNVYNYDSLELFLGFDFGLVEGDTFEYPYFMHHWTDHELTISKVDTVIFADGIPRKRLELSPPIYSICGETTHWVEGVGGMPNPFYFYDCFEQSIEDFSFVENDSVVFGDFVISGANNLSSKPEEQIKIYPNPTSDLLFIESDELEIEHLKLFDMNGRLIFQEELNAKKYSFNIPEELSKGMYFIELVLKDNTATQTRKIIKN